MKGITLNALVSGIPGVGSNFAVPADAERVISRFLGSSPKKKFYFWATFKST
jgi:hypothetical protein